MGDSAAALWESELLRARQWLAATRRDKQQESERLFQRVKAHISYKDHQRSLQSEVAASEDEDDTALDFLCDVNAADMSALLQAEAAKAAVPTVETMPPVENSMPSAGELKPLDMPLNLASPKLKPKVKAVPMSQLDPKALRTSTTTNMTTSATLGTDAAVDALMQDLHLDVTQSQHSDTEETKTEESTPPHVLKRVGESRKVGTTGLQVKASKSEQSKYMQQVSSKSPQDPHRKKVATTKRDDDVAEEMLSWVTGYRDPDVIRRKENMRRKRKHTPRYGMTSEDEQRQVLLQMSRDSDSDSEDDFNSDYSPAEDEEVPEPDEPEVVDLLSDDYLDSDEDKQPVKRKRKRLRQAKPTTKKKKTRSRKPVVTRKLTQQDSTSKVTPSPDSVQKAQPSGNSAASEVSHTPAGTTKSASIEDSDDDTTGKSNHPIELLSSGDETGGSDKGGTPKAVVHPSKNSDDAASKTESEVKVRPKVYKIFKSPRDRFQQEATREKEHTQTEATKTAPATGTVDSCPVVGEVSSGLVSTESVAVGQIQQSDTLRSSSGIVDTVNTVKQSSDANADDVDLSGTGTVDLEGEDLSLETEEDIAVTEVVVDSDNAAQQKYRVANTDEEPRRAETTTGEAEPSAEGDVEDVSEAETTTGEAKPSAEGDDEDVSEAETEMLEDDEPDTDDLGLDYSDDSDSGGKPVTNEKNSTGDQIGTTNSKKGGAVSEQKSTSEKHGGSDSKDKTPRDKKDNKRDASTAGVQQFFDFTPLKLKPKAKTTTSSAPKPLPVHAYAETHSNKGSNDSKKATGENKKISGTPTKSSVGSNGLRSSKKPIATTTTKKGKYAMTRRSTKMLNPEDTPGPKRQPKSQYTMMPTKKSNSNVTKDLDDVPLTILAKELTKKPDDKPQSRYLSYAGAKKTEDAPTYAAEAPRIVPKSRFGGGSGLNPISPATQNFPAASNGQHSQVHDKNVPQKGYRREPQISIYDALHMDGQESSSDIREGTGVKRPNVFKKVQEEAARNGTPMVKSRLQDTDWDKVPIPKKKTQAPQVEKSTQDAPYKTNDNGHKDAAGKTKNKRRKKGLGSSINYSGPSYYGPQAAQLATPDKNEAPSRGRRGRENNNYRRDDDRRRKRSPSPHSRDRDRYDRRGDRSRRGSSRSRSRSPSPRGRDYSSRHRRRSSRSRSRSRERSSECDYRRSARPMSSSRDRDQQTNGSRRSLSPVNRDSSQKKRPTEPELGEVRQNGKVGDTDRSAKKQKTSHYTEAPPSPGALATFDDDGDNMFISDSDDDENVLIKEVEDIRFDLDSISVDESLMARQVYVTGVNPTVFAAQIEEDLARFGVAVDRETGFPAIDIFPCQRNHLGRGDACVTFETKEGAQEAVEELNSKNIKNSMIRVRRMDEHTQRILTAQFQSVRDTWKCTKTQCRADVSIWNAKCDKCGQTRVYGPSNIKIGAESWLCSLCFTANDSFSTSCLGCKESLPEVDRMTFYAS